MAKTSSSLPAGGNLLHNTLLGLNDGDYQHLTILEKVNLELISNKQDSLNIDGTGIKYPTVDAVNAGIFAGSTPDATSIIKGKLKLTNDLGGTADLPTINIKTLNSTSIKGSGDIIIDKTFVGLGNADNTSDLNKPISIATQTALDLKENKSEKNQINGYAGLDGSGKIFSSQLPALAITDTFVVNSQATMLNLTTAEIGDIAVRTDLNKTFILKGLNYSILTDWQELITPTDSVLSVFGRSGAVIANVGDYTTALVTETTDKNYQTDIQKLYNDATSSIQTQLNNKINFASILTGFVTGANSTVSNTDSLEIAIEKLQGQINNKQATLVNPITGTGITGQVSFWDGTSIQSGDNSLFWDNSNKRLGINQPVPTEKLEVIGNIKATSFIKTGALATDLLTGTGITFSTNNIFQLRGSYGSGGENIDTLITSGNYLLSTSSTGTKPAFTIRNLVVIKSEEPTASFITQIGYHETTGRSVVRTSVDVGVTWSAWLESPSGTGTTNTIPKWTSSVGLGNSNIVDNGSNVAVNSYLYTTLNMGIGGVHSTSMKLNLSGTISGGVVSYGIFNQSVVQSDVTSAAYYNRTLAGTQAVSFTLPILTHYIASQGTFGAGSTVTQQIGFNASSTLIDAGTNFGFRGQIPVGVNTNWNVYMDGTAPNHLAGDLRIGTTVQMGTSSLTLRGDGTMIGIRNITNGTTASPTSRRIAWYSNTNSLEVGSIDVPDALATTLATNMTFTVRDSSGVLNERMRIISIGNVGIGVVPTTTATDKLQVNGNITANAATTASHVVIKSQLDLKADLISPVLTGTPTAPTPTAGDNDTSIATTAFVTGAIATAKPYKVYTALISQTGTSAPTVIVLENTLGGTPVWSRIGPGVYSGLLSGFFTANKTTVIFTKQYTVPTGGTDIFTAAGCGSINSIDLSTANTAGLVDGVLSKATIEIRVYN